jgi:hypothetical protein
MKPPVVPHNRPSQVRTYENGRSEMRLTEHAVVIAGGGPAGMMLAAELALAKVDVAVVERRPDHVLVGSRAGGFHSRTIEVLDQRGVADRFLAEGQVAQAAMLATTVLDMSDFPTRHPYSLGIWQNQIERIMAAWIAELPVREVGAGRRDRAAARASQRRVLLAGDAAHVHYPAGGQGLGLQDAVNLGSKLAQVVNGTSPESLLDTHHAERHAVAARALQRTMAQTALQRRDEPIEALVDVVSELASMDEPRKRLAAIISGLDIHYDLGEGHPPLGRRMPDLDLVTADGALRVFELLHDARPVLLNLGEPGGLDITPRADRVQLIDASHKGAWELPVLGAVTAPTAVLIRPDGYVAWVGDGGQLGLPEALTTSGSPGERTRSCAPGDGSRALSHPHVAERVARAVRAS